MCRVPGAAKWETREFGAFWGVWEAGEDGRAACDGGASGEGAVCDGGVSCEGVKLVGRRLVDMVTLRGEGEEREREEESLSGVFCSLATPLCLGGALPTTPSPTANVLGGALLVDSTFLGGVPVMSFLLVLQSRKKSHTCSPFSSSSPPTVTPSHPITTSEVKRLSSSATTDEGWWVWSSRKRGTSSSSLGQEMERV